jgi:hypothetical protein
VWGPFHQHPCGLGLLLLPYPWLVSFLENSGLPGAAERCSVMSLTPIELDPHIARTREGENSAGPKRFSFGTRWRISIEYGDHQPTGLTK